MKLMQTAAGHYALMAYHLTKIPFETGQPVMQKICEDAYHLTNGAQSLSVELLRAAGTEKGRGICHLLVLRCFDGGGQTCRRIAAAFAGGVEQLLSTEGYVFSPLPFPRYAAVRNALDRTETWALAKGELREREALSPTTYVSFPVVEEEIDLRSVYAALDGSGCALSMQMIPCALTSDEQALVAQRYADCSRAADGGYLGPQSPRDSLACFARRRWEYRVQHSGGAAARVNLIVTGPAVRVAAVVARLKGCVTDRHTKAAADLRAFPLAAPVTQIYDAPWQYDALIARQCAAAGYTVNDASALGVARTVTAEEAHALFALPFGEETFCGLEHNAFSLLRRDTLVPKAHLQGDGQSVLIGDTVQGTPFYLPLADFLLHMTVYGKSGVGKTTLQLSLIEQLTRCGVSVLAVEPVKREYRSLARSGKTKVFTVDSSVSPFLINPFLVPRGVTLDQYRPHLLSAFDAAFSMPDPLPSLFGTAISEAYALYGWKGSSRSTDGDVRLFGLWEFVQVFQTVVAESKYSAEIKGNMISGGTFRLLSLIERGRNTFESIRSVDIEELISGEVVLELGRLEGEQKCLVAALTLIGVLSYLRTTRASGSALRNVILLDEAHVLLDNGEGRTDEGQAANRTMERLMVNLVAEMRALGVGIVLADQSPKRIGETLLNNTGTRIAFRLTGTEAKMAAEGIGLNETEGGILPRLDTGEVIFTNHRLANVVGLRTRNRAPTPPMHDDELREWTAPYVKRHEKEHRPFFECDLCDACRDNCRHAVREQAAMIATQLYFSRKAHMGDREGLARHLLCLPATLQKRAGDGGDDARRLAGCVALHLNRKACMGHGVRLPDGVLADILRKNDATYKEVCGNV